ncbi:beta-N-acetylhexosaminidase [Hahella ganghwensis]|uniref:beta-N-acetylhexosaminidase n=1 Tax=Hahella ganghwensis TaxID=286420 RepID=UPI00037DAFB0|nr:beta-N-acetylhexosaminidase [Hahella ganghwensis]
MSSVMPCGPLLIDIEGVCLSSEDISRLSHPLVGGVIFFARNYESRSQLQALVASIRQVRENILICVDQEGGRVQRFREGFSRLPAAGDIRGLAESKGLDVHRVVSNMGFLMAYELREMDIDFSFAPVADVNYQRNTVIGNRAYGETPEDVSVLAADFLQGMGKAGMAGVAKHFPGHGYVKEDTHVETAVDSRSKTEIEADMVPFRRLIDLGVQAVMPAHVVYQAYDSLPAVQSPVMINDVLRGQLGFAGCVISDDLGMSGASENDSVAHRVRAAIDAGCDLIMTCNNSPAIDQALDVLEAMDRDKLLGDVASRRRAAMMPRDVDMKSLKPLAEEARMLLA